MIQSKSRLVALGLTLAVASLAVAPAHAGDALSPTHASTAAKGPLAASAEARVAGSTLQPWLRPPPRLAVPPTTSPFSRAARESR